MEEELNTEMSIIKVLMIIVHPVELIPMKIHVVVIRWTVAVVQENQEEVDGVVVQLYVEEELNIKIYIM